ncbi:MAG: hypothetical protein KF784_20125 [Fimbriimonadaceae bacterium]|nr:hypothetical protein [Fimbriimonadaceae bacterium]
MERYWVSNDVLLNLSDRLGEALPRDKFTPMVKAADAQATIAALQARVKELEESRDAWKASQECSEKAYMELVNQIPAERFDYDPVNVALLDGAKEQEIIGRKQIADLQGLLKRTDENREQWRKLCQEAQSQLTQRTAECDALKLVNDTHMKTVMKLSHVVEQRTAERDCARRRVDELEAREVDVVLLREDLEKRTAELEAAMREVDVWKEKAELRGKEACAQRAELERVRGELAETKEEVKCLDEQVSALNQGCLEYELLLKALPRMEGDVEVYHHESGLRHSVVARPANKYYSSFDTPEEAGAYAAILKHRQGMEG